MKATCLQPRSAGQGLLSTALVIICNPGRVFTNPVICGGLPSPVGVVYCLRLCVFMCVQVYVCIGVYACTHACEGQSTTVSANHQDHPNFGQCCSLAGNSPSRLGWLSSEPGDPSSSVFPMLLLQAQPPHSSFLQGFWGLNSGLQALYQLNQPL